MHGHPIFFRRVLGFKEHWTGWTGRGAETKEQRSSQTPRPADGIFDPVFKVNHLMHHISSSILARQCNALKQLRSRLDVPSAQNLPMLECKAKSTCLQILLNQASTSSWVWPTGRNPTCTFLKIPRFTRAARKPIMVMHRLSDALS